MRQKPTFAPQQMVLLAHPAHSAQAPVDPLAVNVEQAAFMLNISRASPNVNFISSGCSRASVALSFAMMRSRAAMAAWRSPWVAAPANRASILRSLSFNSCSVVICQNTLLAHHGAATTWVTAANFARRNACAKTAAEGRAQVLSYWNQIETYISERTSAAFSHGICPYCKDECFRPGDREPEA